MRGNAFLDKMGLIDPAYVEAADAPPKPKRRRLRWLAAAACICLLAGLALPGLLHPDSGEAPVPDAPQDSPGESLISLAASDTYSSLPQLLQHLSRHDHHSERQADASGGSTVSAETGALTENTGTALHPSMEYAYHIGEGCVQISRLDGADTQNAGTLDTAADALFLCGENLLVISRVQTGGSELDPEYSVRVGIYDVTVPQSPVLKEEYVQRGDLTACWMAGEELYLVTDDGVCACGWSRLSDPSGYYPALTRGGEPMVWDDGDITILGEPTSVQYSAVTVINAATCEVTEKEALYGSIRKLFYGPDWIAVTVSGETDAYRENPAVYTFDGALNFTGRIRTAELLGAEDRLTLKDRRVTAGRSIGIVSVSMQNGHLRMIGTVSDAADPGQPALLAVSVNMETGGAGHALLEGSEDRAFASFTEILWEEDRAILCVGVMQNAFTAEMTMETCFLFADFSGTEPRLPETDLRADYLDRRVGTMYGNPLDAFETLIPMGNGIYLRYADPGQGPRSFAVYDFSDSAEPVCLYAPRSPLSGADAFDYVRHVYDGSTVGTLKVLLGEEDFFRDVSLAWCRYSVDPHGETPVTLLSETPLEGTYETYFGADGLGFSLFEAGGTLYYVTRSADCAAPLS